MQKHVLAFFLFLPILGIAQIRVPTKPTQKPIPRRTTPAPVVRQPVVKEAYASLLVTTDLDITLNVNGDKEYSVKAASLVTKIPLDAGDNLLFIIPADSGNDGYSKTVTIEKQGNTVFTIALNEARRRNTDIARVAEAARQAEARAEAAEQAEAEIINSFKTNMIHVGAGSFRMGGTEQSDEKPIHTVSLSSFYMSKYEVTQAQWRKVMGSDPAELNFKGCDSCPVEKVSYKDISQFLRELNRQTDGSYRLPTEAEWEYAAKGGPNNSSTIYAGSDSLSGVGWYSDNSAHKTHPVGQKKPNKLGLYDMSGNVWEWCSDWYESDYYSSSPSRNLTGGASSSSRVLRGGGWNDSTTNSRVAGRGSYGPFYRDRDLGFRLAASPL